MKPFARLTSFAVLAAAMSAAADEPEPPAAPASAPTKATFLISGLHCPPCTKTLESSLSRERGIRSVRVDWTTKNARVEFDEIAVSAQRVGQLISATPHMMGGRMRYEGWLAIKVPGLKDEVTAAPVRSALSRIAEVKSVTIYPAQHAVGVRFASEGKMTTEQLIAVLRDAGITAANY